MTIPRHAFPTATDAPCAPVGELLRAWRMHRRRSQLELGLAAGVSARHLSFVETGKSRPSAALIGALTEELQVPLRERNALLVAGGYAPRHPQYRWDAPALSTQRAAVERILRAHDPAPGLALDRHWNVVHANAAATRLAALLPPHVHAPHPNAFRMGLHPEGLARLTRNFPTWGRYLLRELDRLVQAMPDSAALALRDEIHAYPTVRALRSSREEHARGEVDASPRVLVPFELQLGTQRLSFFSTLATFGSPRDVTLSELTVELFYAGDDATDEALHAMQGSGREPGPVTAGPAATPGSCA